MVDIYCAGSNCGPFKFSEVTLPSGGKVRAFCCRSSYRGAGYSCESHYSRECYCLCAVIHVNAIARAVIHVGYCPCAVIRVNTAVT